ncbi:unnamed protein product, partial [Notodromas monacha]
MPDYWLKDQKDLLGMILDRSRSLGMKPVLPCFPGFVPQEVLKKNPGSTARQLTTWNNFNCPNYSWCASLYLLDPGSVLYSEISQAFVKQLIADFGTDHLYSCDLFNENGIPGGVDPVEYLNTVGKGVYNSLAAVDPDAIWVMQGWMLENSGQWTPALAEALLTSVPIGSMLVLDLYAEMFPQYPKFKSFYGQPFVFCLLNNFGGRKGMFGDIEDVVQGPRKALNFENSSLAGIGIAPEGIHSNYVLYDVFLELPLYLSKDQNHDVDVEAWTHEYGMRRYGLSMGSDIHDWHSVT